MTEFKCKCCNKLNDSNSSKGRQLYCNSCKNYNHALMVKYLWKIEELGRKLNESESKLRMYE